MRARLIAPLAAAALAGCGDPRPDDKVRAVPAPEAPRIGPAGQALAGAFVPRLDPERMEPAEIEAVLGSGPRCEFQYTSGGKPVLAARGAGGTAGVVKLNGWLIPLESAPGGAPDNGAALAAERIGVRIAPIGAKPLEEADAGRRWSAEMVFKVDPDLTVGYRGYWRCIAASEG